MTRFAETLKKLRLQSGMSMQELADAASVSKSMICKIESDKVQPTIDVAGRLSKALGKPLSEMLHAPQGGRAIHLSKAEQAVWEDSQKIKRKNISPVFGGLKLEWLQVTMPAKVTIDKNAQMYGVGADKYVLVIKGNLDITLNGKVYKLKKDDSFYFEADSPHTFTNAGKDTCEFYIVIKHAG